MASLPSMECFLPLIWGFRQTKTYEEMEWSRECAEAQYPDMRRDEALLAYTKREKTPDVFFPDDQGRRCVWGRDIYFYQNKTAFGYRHRTSEDWDLKYRKYLVFDTKQTIKHVDERRNQWAVDLLKHYSEDGWARPQTDNTHFSKLPLDIQSMILDYVLTPPISGERFVPKVVSCNWKAAWCVPHYEEISGDVYEINSTLRVERVDHNGPYIELRDVHRTAIDATILRVSKQFQSLGAEKLYGHNSFSFSMHNPTRRGSPPSLFGPANHRTVYQPFSVKPKYGDQWETEVTKVISQMECKVKRTRLSGWAYYDNFLRFLYLVGGRNAAFLPDLMFSGQIKLHDCAESQCGTRCDDDLVESLELYGPFLVYFCKGLKKLTLNTYRDLRAPRPIRNKAGVMVDPTAEAILPFLKERLPRVESLRTLVVLEGDEPAAWAQDVVDWFEQRGKNRDLMEEKRKDGLLTKYLSGRANELEKMKEEEAAHELETADGNAGTIDGLCQGLEGAKLGEVDEGDDDESP